MQVCTGVCRGVHGPRAFAFFRGAVLSVSRPIFDPLDESDDEDAAERLSDDYDSADADDDDDLPDDDDALGDGVADVAATVWCPYCGEPTEVAIDPGGGAAQEYVEDCAVCCRPWRVTVAYGADGSASVSAVSTDE